MVIVKCGFFIERYSLNVVFVGSSKFGLRCLNQCLQFAEINVVGVVTSPKVFSISYNKSGVNNVLHAGVGPFASQHAIPFKIMESSMNEPCLLEEVSKWNPDIFLVVGWYHIVPESWLRVAPAYGLHASLLPNYSGGAPLVWAMINGETKTGITLFQMDAGIDSGPVVGFKEEQIRINDTIATLYQRIEERGLELLLESLPLFVSGEMKLQLQDESKRKVMSQRSPKDGKIDWSMSSIFIDRFIRAQTKPYPGAFSFWDGEQVIIWDVSLCEKENDSLIGFVVKENDGCRVYCGKGSVILNEVSFRNKSYTYSEIIELFKDGGRFNKLTVVSRQK